MDKFLNKPMILHFSHEHLLERGLSPTSGGNCICFGCKLEISPGKHCYKCRTCSFYLHQVCYNMPQKVQHPVDPKHHLTLLALPPSNDKSIDCDACQQPITGFYYNCASCATFYHMLCLGTPLSVKLPAHPHKLELEFTPPYQFQCDLCHRASNQGWLYRCGSCEVDVHISCAMMNSQDKNHKNKQPGTKRPSNASRGGDGERREDDKRQELMVLLFQGIMGSQKDKQAFQDRPPTPSASDIVATPSIQFSDACFSIDIERSFSVDDLASKGADIQHQSEAEKSKDANNPKQAIHQVVSMTKKPSFDSYIVDPPKVQKLVTSPSIGSHVLSELGPEKQQTHVKPPSNKATKKSGSARFRCSCW